MKYIRKSLFFLLVFISLSSFKCLSSDIDTLQNKGRIYFSIATQDIASVDTDGNNLRKYLTGGTSISVVGSNNSGTKIYYYSSSGLIYSINPNTGEDKYEVNLGADSPTLSFSSDSKKFIHSSMGMAYIYNTVTGINETFMSTGCEYPSFSPDGQRIAYADSDKLYTVKTDKSDVKLVKSYAGTGTVSYPSWSSDSRKIVYVLSLFATYYIAVIDADGTKERYVYSYSSLIYSPVFSPDGTKIAFYNDGKIYIINLDGSGLKMISGSLNCVENLTFLGKSN